MLQDVKLEGLLQVEQLQDLLRRQRDSRQVGRLIGVLLVLVVEAVLVDPSDGVPSQNQKTAFSLHRTGKHDWTDPTYHQLNQLRLELYVPLPELKNFNELASLNCALLYLGVASDKQQKCSVADVVDE